MRGSEGRTAIGLWIFGYYLMYIFACICLPRCMSSIDFEVRSVQSVKCNRWVIGKEPCHETASVPSKEDCGRAVFLRDRYPPQRIMLTPFLFPIRILLKQLRHHCRFNIPGRNRLNNQSRTSNWRREEGLNIDSDFVFSPFTGQISAHL